MFETLRKAMLFGVGAAAMSWDKVRQVIDDLVERGEITTEEGKKLYTELTARIEEEGRSMNERIRTQVRTMLKELGVADRAQVAMLESRIEALERKIHESAATQGGPETAEE